MLEICKMFYHKLFFYTTQNKKNKPFKSNKFLFQLFIKTKKIRKVQIFFLKHLNIILIKFDLYFNKGYKSYQKSYIELNTCKKQ